MAFSGVGVLLLLLSVATNGPGFVRNLGLAGVVLFSGLFAFYVICYLHGLDPNRVLMRLPQPPAGSP